MKHLILVFVAGGLWGQSTPNCSQALSFGSATAGTPINTIAGAAAGCAGWRLTWSVTGFTAATIQLEGSQDNSSWSAFGSSLVQEGTNPTSWTSGTASNTIVVRASLPYVRVNITGVTGSGTIKTLILGYSGTSAQLDTGGGGAPSGPAGGDLTGSYPNPVVAQMQSGKFIVNASTGAGTLAGAFQATSIVGTGTLTIGTAGVAGASAIISMLNVSAPVTSFLFQPAAALQLQVQVASGGSGEVRGLDVAAPTLAGGGSISNNSGVYVEDQSGVSVSGSTYNIVSKGTGSKNLFEGQLNTMGLVSTGTKFTISGCSAGTTLGGATAGSFHSGTSGTCTVTVTMAGATGLTAPNGWACGVNDLTTPADVIHQTGTSQTTATFSGTTVSGDVVNFACTGY